MQVFSVLNLKVHYSYYGFWKCIVACVYLLVFMNRALSKLGLSWRRRLENSRFETFTVFWMLYAFFWVIPRHLHFISRRFGTLYLFHLHRQVGAPTCLWRWNIQSVSKRRHIKFRRREITQKKASNIQSTAKVWNQELYNLFSYKEFTWFLFWPL